MMEHSPAFSSFQHVISFPPMGMEQIRSSVIRPPLMEDRNVPTRLGCLRRDEVPDKEGTWRTLVIGSLGFPRNPPVSSSIDVFPVTNRPMQMVQNVMTKLKHSSPERGNPFGKAFTILNGAATEVFLSEGRSPIGCGVSNKPPHSR